MHKSIGQLCQEYHLDRGTLLKAAKIPHLLGQVAKKSGHIWLIDDESKQFDAWLRKHLAAKHASQRGTATMRTRSIAASRARLHRNSRPLDML